MKALISGILFLGGLCLWAADMADSDIKLLDVHKKLSAHNAQQMTDICRIDTAKWNNWVTQNRTHNDFVDYLRTLSTNDRKCLRPLNIRDVNGESTTVAKLLDDNNIK
ncbi:MAG TPA: hypothetical protein VKB79_24975 [Bryobacteraceae bacterium]|nr:hypothetical protein [Bryobacteraceae bacterium]